MTIDELKSEVNRNLFESEFELYEESIKLILQFFRESKDNFCEEQVDLMQEVLDNKINTYVQGDYSENQKNDILKFTEFHWKVSLVKMRIEVMEEIRIDSFVSHLLDILVFISPLNGEVKRLLTEFLFHETNAIYRNWMELRLSNL